MAGRESSGGALGVAIIAAMAMLFVAFVLVLPLTASWNDDVCAARGPQREGTTITQSHSVWPPGTRCRFVAPHGRTVERFVDAGPWEPLKWPALLLLAGAPLTLGAGLVASIRRLRPGPATSPSRRFGGIPH